MVVLYAQTSCDLRHIHIPRIQCLILPGRSGVVETKSSSGSDCHYHPQTNQNDIIIIIIIQSCIIVCHSYCRSNAIITRLLGIGRRDYVHYFPYRTGLWKLSYCRSIVLSRSWDCRYRYLSLLQSLWYTITTNDTVWDHCLCHTGVSHYIDTLTVLYHVAFDMAYTRSGHGSAVGL